MYVPPFNAINDGGEVRAFVEHIGSAEFISIGPEGYPVATLLPIMWHDDTVIAHMARANPQWKAIADDSPALLIVAGEQAYVSPAWYRSKAEHGRVVPTWNYESVHLTGRVSVHEDAEWLRKAVTDLTEAHEASRVVPWEVSDAPESYIEGQLRGIIGLEFTVERVEAKAKLSQNRSEADQRGVVEGLRKEGKMHDLAIANRMDEIR